MKNQTDAWVGAAEAASLLGVSRSTLYAYVSRGLVRSEPLPGVSRQRQYSRDDIERLRSRTAQRRDPETAATQTLRWGLPVLESAITLISDDRIYFRGHDAEKLAETRSIAEVANLIWTGSFTGAVSPGHPEPIALRKRTEELPFIAQAQVALAEASARDSGACDLRHSAVARTGWRILNLLAQVAGGSVENGRTIDEQLAESWGVPEATPIIRAALILCADHELNVSAFTARCVASAGTSAYGVVGAALAALEGFRHGGATARLESLWDSVRDSGDLEQSLATRLRRGERLDGFGHPLYASGDPRARLLLDRLPPSQESEFAARFAAASREVLGESPVLDFGLVAVRRSLGLPEGAALMLFAIGRTIGWVGHAIEQYALDSLIRPRAKYIGDLPTTQ